MISSHILDELGKLADSYGIIHEGLLLDQFTSDELHKRCGQFVSVRTGDNNRAVDVLRKGGFENVEIDHDNNIRVNERLDDSDVIAKLIVNANIPLKELFVNNISLEDYYLSVTGGEHNG